MKSVFLTVALAVGASLPAMDVRQVFRPERYQRDDLFRATDYFRYYLFRVYAKMGRMDLFLKKMDFWRDHVKWGIRCPLKPGRQFVVKSLLR